MTPGRLERVVRWFLPRGARGDSVIGDLREAFAARARTAGLPEARRWFRRQALSLIAGYWKDRLLGRVAHGGAANALTVPLSALDVKLGFRMLVKHPGLTVVAGFALALGIGFSAILIGLTANLVDPSLPFEDGDRIMTLRHWNIETSEPEAVTASEFLAWQDRLESFEALGALTSAQYSLIAASGRAEPITGIRMTARAFGILQVPARLGRPLVSDDEVDGAPPVAVIGYDLWQTRFGGDPQAVGRTIRLGNDVRTVVGVMPKGFLFPVRHGLWMPLPVRAPPEQGGEIRLRVFGKLAAGVTVAEAQAELSAVGRRSAAEYPDTHEQFRPQVMPYARSFVEPGMDTVMVGSRFVLVLFLAVACANVGTLLVARNATRLGEIAVRSALGASRRRLVAQLFVEASILSAMSAAVGLLAVGWASSWLEDIPFGFPFWIRLGLQPTAIWVAVGLTVFSALVAGLPPALRATGRGLSDSLRLNAAGGSGRFGMMSTGLIITEIVLSVAFLTGALHVSGAQLGDVAMRVGFAADEFLVARVGIEATGTSVPSRAGALRERRAEVHEELIRRMERAPGVQGVTYASQLPVSDPPLRRAEIEGGGVTTEAHTVTNRVRVTWVDPEYFATLGAPVVAGREFHSGDLDSTRGTVIVNEAFVRHLLGERNPIGRRVRYANSVRHPPGEWFEIVGVVPDFGVNPLDMADAARLYHPVRPGEVHPIRVAVRLGDDPAAFGPRLVSLAAEVDPTMWVADVMPWDAMIAERRLGFTIIASILSLLALMTLMLAAAGVYALMSFTVSRRTREIGIRTALGAYPRRIVAAIFSRALLQLGAGVAGGWFLGLRIVRLGADDSVRGGPEVFAAVAAVMMVVGLFACVPPTRRALRIQPTEALRQDG